MLFSPYFTSGIGQGAAQGLLNKIQQENYLQRMAQQHKYALEQAQKQVELDEQAKQDMFNFYKNQVLPDIQNILPDDKASGLLANLFARTGNLPISPFLPQRPRVEKVKQGESLVYVTPEGQVKQLFDNRKKNYTFKVIDGNVAVFDDNGNLLHNYEISKKTNKGNYTLYQTKPYRDSDGKWKYEVLVVDKNTGNIKKISTKLTKEPGENKMIKIGGVSYDKDLLNLATKMINDYLQTDPMTGKIIYNGQELTPEEAAVIKSMLVKEVYDRLLYTKQKPNPTNPGTIGAPSVLDLFK